MPIYITKTTTGLLIQKDACEIAIDGPAIATALPSVLHELISSGRAAAQARREGYEDGLIQGRINATIEQATSERIAERQAADLVDILVGVNVASAA